METKCADRRNKVKEKWKEIKSLKTLYIGIHHKVMITKTDKPKLNASKQQKNVFNAISKSRRKRVKMCASNLYHPSTMC